MTGPPLTGGYKNNGGGRFFFLHDTASTCFFSPTHHFPSRLGTFFSIHSLQEYISSFYNENNVQTIAVYVS